MTVQKRQIRRATDAPNPKTAVQNFVEQAQKNQPYLDVAWDDPVWNIGASNVKARAHLNNSRRVYFTPHYAPRVPMEKRVPFEKPFADLVKALTVKRRLDRGMESGPQLVFVRAARYLYDALPLPARRDITLLARGHFVAAESAALIREKPSSAYRVGVMLEELGETLDRLSLTRASVSFQSSVARPANEDRTAAEFEERVGRLPSQNAIESLASIANDSRLKDSAGDRLLMRVVELLFVCGFRIGEALTLPEKTLVREFVLDDGELRKNAATGEPQERIGLRYWPEKSGEPIVKWVSTEAGPLVLRAIEEINEICKPARENAKWLERNPGRVRLNVQAEQKLSMAQAGKLLGLDRQGFYSWLKRREGKGIISPRGKSGSLYVLGRDLHDTIALERFDKPMLIKANGKTQTLGDSLLVTFLWRPYEDDATDRFISAPVTYQQVRDFLTGRPKIPSIFERFGVFDEMGKPYHFRSHDFRRLINIVAQRGGLSQVEIAGWMGRRRIQDNAAYDLRTSAEMAAEMRTLVEKNEVFGDIANQVRALPELERSDFLKNRLTMLHTTPHGQCGSNIAETPCETAVSCLGGCRHYLRRKNDARSRVSLLRIERETLEALDRASEAADNGKPLAKNWVEAHETVLRTVRAALAIDDDPTIADGELQAVNPDGPVLGVPL